MENAVDALKIAFAVFVFTMALSIGMYMFNQAKATADVVLASSDAETYATYTNAIEGIETTTEGDRVVGLETIIPTLYKYYKENYTVVFLENDGTPLELYTTRMSENPQIRWSKGFINKYYNDDYELRVCSFDVDEETSRHEPWTGSANYYKQNLDMFLSGGTFYAPSRNAAYDYNYSDSHVNGWGKKHGFIEEYQDAQFRESIGQYTYSDITSEVENDPNYGNSGLTNTAPKTKRVIVYTLMN